MADTEDRVAVVLSLTANLKYQPMGPAQAALLTKSGLSPQAYRIVKGLLSRWHAAGKSLPLHYKGLWSLIEVLVGKSAEDLCTLGKIIYQCTPVHDPAKVGRLAVELGGSGAAIYHRRIQTYTLPPLDADPASVRNWFHSGRSGSQGSRNQISPAA